MRASMPRSTWVTTSLRLRLVSMRSSSPGSSPSRAPARTASRASASNRSSSTASSSWASGAVCELVNGLSLQRVGARDHLARCRCGPRSRTQHTARQHGRPCGPAGDRLGDPTGRSLCPIGSGIPVQVRRCPTPSPGGWPDDRTTPSQQWRADRSLPNETTVAARRRARSGVSITVMVGTEWMPSALIAGTSSTSTSSTTQASSRPSPRAP